ncbi:MAG: hypothetical protein ACRYFX_09300 [Janthinobacterium lividum]
MDKPLLPFLKGALTPKVPYSVEDGFRTGDLLHLLAEVAGRPAGTVLPVLGQCRCPDAHGRAWRLLAYVPASPTDCTTYAGRQASRFPEAGQVERWFAGVQMRFTEIDITDWADSLALERQTEAIVIQMYPTHRQAERLRNAA